MGWFTGIVVFLLVWMVTLFTVLPWGAVAPDNPEAGHAASAPADPRLGRKFLITTAIAAAIWMVVYILIAAEIVDFYGMAERMVEEDSQ